MFDIRVRCIRAMGDWKVYQANIYLTDAQGALSWGVIIHDESESVMIDY